MRARRQDHPLRDPPWIVGAFVAVTLAYVGLVLVLPLATVFTEALRHGVSAYVAALADPDALAAMWLTLAVAGVVVPLNTLFGIAAAWAIAKFEFPGKALLLTLIDLPFSVSPVIAGLSLVLLYGAHGWLAPVLQGAGVQIIFTVVGVTLATLFVTAPFVARELIPLMEAQGTDEEAAAQTLGASGLRTFLLVTLPNVRWALLYGVLLCSARALGEFGAVAVVSGHIRGKTATLPLQVEILYSEFSYSAAFAVASLLAMFALVALALKTLVEARFDGDATPQRQR